MSASINKYFDITPIGRVLSKFNADMNAFNSNIVWTFRSIFTNISKALFFCWFLSSVAWWSVLAIIFFSYLTAGYGIYHARVRRKVNKVAQAHRSPQVSILHQALTGKMTIRVFGKESIFQR